MSIHTNNLPKDILSIVIDAMETEYEMDQIEACHSGECRANDKGEHIHTSLEDYWSTVTTVELEFVPELGWFIITSYS